DCWSVLIDVAERAAVSEERLILLESKMIAESHRCEGIDVVPSEPFQRPFRRPLLRQANEDTIRHPLRLDQDAAMFVATHVVGRSGKQAVFKIEVRIKKVIPIRQKVRDSARTRLWHLRSPDPRCMCRLQKRFDL